MGVAVDPVTFNKNNAGCRTRTWSTRRLPATAALARPAWSTISPRRISSSGRFIKRNGLLNNPWPEVWAEEPAVTRSTLQPKAAREFAGEGEGKRAGGVAEGEDGGEVEERRCTCLRV